MSDLNERTKQIVAKQLGITREQIVDDSSLIDDLGADSLDIVELIMEIEDQFDIEIPDAEIEDIQTVGALAACIEKHQAD